MSAGWMPELEVDSLSCCFRLQILVLLFVHPGYELLIVGGDFEQVFFHEEFEVVEHVFFFGVGEEDAVDCPISQFCTRAEIVCTFHVIS